MNVRELINALEQFPEYREVELQIEVDTDDSSTVEHYPLSAIFERQTQAAGNVTVVIR